MDRRKRVAGGVLLLAAAVAAGLWFVGSDDEQGGLLASGTVEATDGRLGFQGAGRVQEIRAREGDAVREGDTLAVLDREEALARREAAEAEVEAVSAELDELESGFRSEEISQARATTAAAAERREDARRDLERTRRLWEAGATSREAFDKARTAFQVASAVAERSAEQLSLLKSGPRPERIRAARARLRRARASSRSLEATLDQMVVTAPFDGVVTVRHREPGETVSPGSAVLTLMNPDDRWVRIYVREDRIGAVRLGQAASITTDTYPERSYDGEVRFIASEAEFTPKNVQTTEERVKLVYAVKVQVVGDEERDLKPGMPADVRLETEAP